jgi:hypothetical protein
VRGGTVGRIRQFGDQHGSSIGSKGETETDQEAGTNEHSNRLRSCLDGDGDTHDDCTNEDGRATAKAIRQVRSKWVRRKSSNVLNAVQQAELSTSWEVEISLPLRQTLETVHHTSIITVR